MSHQDIETERDGAGTQWFRQGGTVYLLNAKGTNRLSAHVFQGKADDGVTTVPPEEADDAARLIAAAPDLLEACKTVLAHVEDETAERVNEQCTLCYSHCELLRNAIARATH